MTQRYILKHGLPVPEPDLLAWARWFEDADRIVEQTRQGDVTVSTVFLALDHNFTGDGPPLLFETMVFNGEHDGESERYATREEADGSGLLPF